MLGRLAITKDYRLPTKDHGLLCEAVFPEIPGQSTEKRAMVKPGFILTALKGLYLSADTREETLQNTKDAVIAHIESSLTG